MQSDMYATYHRLEQEKWSLAAGANVLGLLSMWLISSGIAFFTVVGIVGSGLVLFSLISQANSHKAKSEVYGGAKARGRGDDDYEEVYTGA